MNHDVQLYAPKPPPTAAGRWWLFHGLLLFAYALFGKGAAYLGKPPLYIGEILLAAGLFVLLLTPGWGRVFLRPQIWLLIPFMIWNAFQTFPSVRSEGVDALRDGALGGYGVFVVIAAGLIVAEPQW